MNTVFAPGKLFIAGEYAVVTPHAPAILIAVNRGITITYRASSGVGSVQSSYYDTPLKWWITADREADFTDGFTEDLVSRTIRLCVHLAAERDASAIGAHFVIESTLDHDDGRKLGLGSSAAVTVALVAACNDLFRLGLSQHERFLVALVSVLGLSPRASGADIATSTFGGWLWYRSLDREALLADVENEGLHHTLLRWRERVEVQQLPTPSAISVAVGWSGEPVLTDQQVSRRDADPAVLRAFLTENEHAVRELADALHDDDAARVIDAVQCSQRALETYDVATGGGIETERLRELRLIAEAHGAVAKVSGAGGGDCGVALSQSHESISRIKEDWKASGIIPLDIFVDDRGARLSMIGPVEQHE